MDLLAFLMLRNFTLAERFALARVCKAFRATHMRLTTRLLVVCNVSASVREFQCRSSPYLLVVPTWLSDPGRLAGLFQSLPALTRLKLTELVGGDFLLSFLPRCPQLRSLTIKVRCPLTEDLFVALVQAPPLQRLVVSSDDDGVQSTPDALARFWAFVETKGASMLRFSFPTLAAAFGFASEAMPNVEASAVLSRCSASMPHCRDIDVGVLDFAHPGKGWMSSTIVFFSLFPGCRRVQIACAAQLLAAAPYCGAWTHLSLLRQFHRVAQLALHPRSLPRLTGLKGLWGHHCEGAADIVLQNPQLRSLSLDFPGEERLLHESHRFIHLTRIDFFCVEWEPSTWRLLGRLRFLTHIRSLDCNFSLRSTCELGVRVWPTPVCLRASTIDFREGLRWLRC